MNFPHLDWPSILGGGVVTFLATRTFDWWLEGRKVRWSRASWVYQRQVEALTKLFVEFHRMQDLLHGATLGFTSPGDMSQESYFEKWQDKLAKTWFEYIENRLLLSEAIVARIDELFEKFTEAGIAIRSAPIYREGELRKEAAAEEIKAKEIAQKLVPPLLAAIESDARRVIHAEAHL